MNRDGQDPGPNFWAAMLLSMLVIFGYPYFVRWITPPSPAVQEAPPVADEPLPAPTEEKPAEIAIAPLQPPPTEALENAFFMAEFSPLGGTVTRLFYKGNEQSSGVSTLFFEATATSPGSFGTEMLNEDDRLSEKIFQREPSAEPGSVEFVYEKTGEYRIRKKFLLDDDAPTLRLSITIENLSAREKHFPLALSYAFQVDSADKMALQHHEALGWTEKIVAANLDKLRKKGFEIKERLAWSGSIKKYFALLVKPDWNAVALEARADQETVFSTLILEPLSVAPGARTQRKIFVYAGPQHYETLKRFDLGFENILSKGFFGILKVWLLVTLKFFYRFTHNYGWAIVLLTLLIKGIFAPLTHLSYKSMKKMQAIQPKLKALQQQHKGNPERLNKETMELFRRNRVNPMAGCLPMLIQIPVFIAMFRLLPEAIELKGAPFLWWIRDLSEQDRLWSLPFSLPLLGWDALNVLPILMILSQIGYQKIMPQTGTSPEQTKIMNLMPVFFGFICYSMPSGLVLYWIVQNVLTIVQQVFVNRIVVVLHHEDRDT
ncbi:MAG: membrane protein insertase YidC [Candidatus Omnitrophota bacterium]